MSTVDFVPFATDPGANVQSQAAYIAASSTDEGFSAGIASSANVNKVWRQSSFMGAVLATFMSNQTSSDVLDDGNLATAVAKLLLAIQNTAIAQSWTTGDVKTTLKTAADAGWVMMNDGTIGNAASGGTTRANADTQALFVLLWTNVSNTYAPVSGGRGANALADFNANKTIALPKTLGRVLGASGAGSGLTARTLGQTVGEETHLQSSGELATHLHTATSVVTDPLHNHVAGSVVTDPTHLHAPSNAAGFITGGSTVSGSGANGLGSAANTNSVATGITVATTTTNHATNVTVATTTSNQGSSTPFNVMQPTVFLNYMVKL